MIGKCRYCKLNFVTKDKRRKYCCAAHSNLGRAKVKDRPAAEAILAEINKGGAWAEIARRHGVHVNTVKRWAGVS